ncbi:hypothetical protein PR048_025534 [Dryococelus australis]|uniref:Reverse transcriptase RNase H-like domain-containing protein n=1 Tax=Dryococelus australis TaxID=614101 RepID=A0ABQ9GRM2_9NEOP|nr:hypothetical protein PR048_025534 [Dryococelus australis]
MSHILRGMKRVECSMDILIHAATKEELEAITQEAIYKLKQARLNPNAILRYYDHTKPVTLSVDSSSHLVTSVLLQGNQPVCYASKSLSKAQLNYSQVEKEALTILVACKKVHEYIWGNQNVLIESDHKPLEAIFKKPRLYVPAMLQRILFEVLQCNPIVSYKMDRNQTATTVQNQTYDMQVVITMSKESVCDLKEAIDASAKLSNIRHTILNGWPTKHNLLCKDIQKYWTYR